MKLDQNHQLFKQLEIHKKSQVRRYLKTLNFLEKVISKEEKNLDLGQPNKFSMLMSEIGYDIKNTEKGLDLDINYEVVKNSSFDVVTAFEIFEHMVAPFNVLRAITAKKLVASIPLKLWFANAYWNENDPWDRHYHEFEPRQFDMLLEKSGWEIKRSEKWTSYDQTLGIRPLLRRITPRYYIVYCERSVRK
jgi:hypothetical protein